MVAEKIKKKRTSHFPGWLTIFRIALGLVLFWKGISFIKDIDILASKVYSTRIGLFDKHLEIVSFIIAYLNLLGGLFIAVGLFTRWASVVQIPILLGAVFLVNLKGGINFSNGELVLSVLVLILLFVFAKKGSGLISADEFFRNYTYAGMESGHTKKLFH